jgi:hypothetical protein
VIGVTAAGSRRALLTAVTLLLLLAIGMVERVDLLCDPRRGFGEAIGHLVDPLCEAADLIPLQVRDPELLGRAAPAGPEGGEPGPEGACLQEPQLHCLVRLQ